MNGRVYDPSIGRFLSADTYIQDPCNTQSYNRYSYVINNPLKYTDPSGHWFWLATATLITADQVFNDGKLTPTIVAMVAAAYTGYIASESFLWGSLGAGSSVATSTLVSQSAIIAGAAGGAAFGASSTLLNGGSVSDAITGSVAGVISGGIAGHYGNTWNAQSIGASAVGSGISAELQGDKFSDGFKIGVVSASLRHLYNKVAKMDVNGRHGESDPRFKDKNMRAFKNTNNVSHAHMVSDYPDSNYQTGQLVPDHIIDLKGGEGSPFSNALNMAPFGINAVAGFYDNMYAYFGVPFYTYTTNPIGMIPAAAITYGAMADRYDINTQLYTNRRR